MTPTIPRRILITSLIACAATALPTFADEPNVTQAAQDELRDLQETHRDASKQVELKRAAVVVAEDRASELQKELAVAQQRVAAERAALANAEAQAASVAKNLELLTAKIDRHEHADELLKVAAAAAAELETAEQKKAQLEARRAELQAAQFEQQQVEIRSTGELKIVQDQLPAKMKELTAAREALDAAAKEVELAQGEQVAVPDLVMGAPADGEGHVWGVLGGGGWVPCKRT